MTEHQHSEKEWSVDEVAEIDREMEQIATGAPAAEETSPPPPLPSTLAKQFVSGLYRGDSGMVRLDLRVDVDRLRPTRRISGDFYKISGSTMTYFGSFLINAPQIKVTATEVTVSGMGTFSFTTPTPFVSVRMKRMPASVAPAPAVVVLSSAAGAAGTTYNCTFLSRSFRTVQWEQDSIENTKPFSAYDVGLLPSPGPRRTLTVPAAFGEAGIEVQVAGVSNVFQSNAGATWSNAELHASMVEQFSLWADQPQWRVWLLVATRHDIDNVRGIMFDQAGKQRQGCAVFHDLVGGDEPARQRAALRTYVHELGHCFNLLHSWQKNLAVPPAPNRLDALSWMNYVQNFPGGESAYWSAFPFQFDELELVHLRHGFRNNVIMGGSDFQRGAADVDELMLSRPVSDNSGLDLRLEMKTSYRLSEPVVVEVRLSALDLRGKQVHSNLHPNYGFVRVAIRNPSGSISLYRPIIEQCLEAEFVTLTPENPSIYTSAYVGYGKDGFYFTQPGFYELRALYQAPDGSDVVSNIVSIRVGAPRTDADEDIADAYFGDDQGKLFYLLGSDSVTLKSGNDSFGAVIEHYPDHPLTAYAQLVWGINANRAFKTVTPEKTLHTRAKAPAQSAALLAGAARPGVLDNITLNMATRQLARAQAEAGNPEQGLATLDEMVGYFRKKQLKPHVQSRIENQAERARAAIEKDYSPRATRSSKRRSAKATKAR